MANTNVYAVKAKNREIQKQSSSGGAFIVISDYVLNSGGAIACSVYSYSTHTLDFCILDSTIERNRAIGSKYFQSNPCGVFEECYLWVKTHPNQVLMFVGMGCQAAAFKLYAEKKGIKKNTLIVDIVCHGVPSPQMWREYVENIQKKYHERLTSLDFKDKRNGWEKPTAVAKVGGKEVLLRDWIRVFNSGMALRPSCYACPYTCTNRQTDITIGDYWGIEKTHPEFFSQLGVSLLLIHSDKGRDYFDLFSKDFDYIETSIEDCLQPQLIRPSIRADARSEFWEDYDKRGISFVMRKYGNISIFEKMKYRIRGFLTRINICRDKNVYR